MLFQREGILTGLFSIAIFSSFLASNFPLSAQSAAARYREAARVFCEHTSGDFLHDDTREGINALAQMWAASAQSAVEVLLSNPDASTSDLDSALAGLSSKANGCGGDEGSMHSVVLIAPHLLLASYFSGEAGTVFLLGFRDKKPVVLWSIDSAAPQKADPHDLLGGWKADRAGGHCREKGSGHPPGTCGPLYASVGTLTPDAAGRPRFYIDAGYAQIMGATVGHQTSVWRWDGDSAMLLWIDWHDFMIDQRIGTEFTDGVLSIGEKDNFRTFYSCGSCEERQMVRRLRITPEGIVDLGKVSTSPELDLIDQLFWRLHKNKRTTEIATPEVTRFLRALIAEEEKESKKIEPDWFSVGMLDDYSIRKSGDKEDVCFTGDDIGRLYFTIEQERAGAWRFIKVTQPEGKFETCPK